MHEWTIAENLVQQLVEIGGREGLATISQVSVRVGVLRQIVNETLAEAFGIQAEETIARGAKLEVTTIPVSFRCRSCAGEKTGEENFLAFCPKCGSRELEIISGKELYIDFIEGEKGTST